MLKYLIDHDWGAQRIINMYYSWKKQLSYILWKLGLESIRELRPEGEVKFKHGRFNHLVHLDHAR